MDNNAGFFQDKLSLDKIFLAQITAVYDDGDTTGEGVAPTLLMDIQISETVGAQKIPVPVIYMSHTAKCGILVVPRVGDLVFMAMRQSRWVAIGYCMNTYFDQPPEITTEWSQMFTNTDEASGAAPHQLNEGDFGIFNHDDDTCLDFLMIDETKQIIMSAGTVHSIMDQENKSIKEMADYFLKMAPDENTTIEFGAVRYNLAGQEQTIPDEYIFSVTHTGTTQDEAIELGCIVSDTGVPETNSTGGFLRARILVGSTEISIDSDGNVEITTEANVLIDASKDIKLQSDTLTVKNDTTKVDSTTINVNATDVTIKCDDITIETSSATVTANTVDITAGTVTVDGNVDITGNTTIDGTVDIVGNTEITGDESVIGGVTITGKLAAGPAPKKLVTADLLQILASHTHPYAGPIGTTQISPVLQMIQIFKTMTSELT